MALATLTDALPTGPSGERPSVAQDGSSPARAGLSARMSSLRTELASLVADLAPGLLLGGDAAALYADFAGLEHLVTAGKALLAPRIAESGHWQEEGHRSPADLLATLEGGSAGQAKRTLEAGRRLADLPGTEEALRKGTLSGPKLVEITHAASLDPGAEGLLLAGSGTEPLHVVKERCQKVRTQATTADPAAALARIHRDRSFTSWTDAEGAFCFRGRDTAERGAKLLARLVPVANRLRNDRRAAVTGATSRHPTGTAPPEGDTEAALRMDALALLLGAPGGTPTTTGTPRTTEATGTPGTPGTTAASGTTRAGHGDTEPTAEPLHLGSAHDVITAAPPATVIVRVDLEALRRGHALPGELCEVEGQGTVPVPVVQSLADDAFLACVFTEAGDIRAVAHLGRTINQHLRTALALRDRRCVVPGCGVAYSLEIDHVIPLEAGGDTRLGNLALLCRHHHRLKTYAGWTLERTGPTDEDPGWRFTPMPAFGQEPDLGFDRPGGRDGWNRPPDPPDPSDPSPRT